MTYLLRGDEYLNKNHPEFRLIGRDAELKELSAILMRQKANSVLLVGPAGVGSTAICLGLQAMKKDPNAPLDIISKRFYWLDTDALFASGDGQKINSLFQADLEYLWRQPDDVLVIKDTRNFIEASERSGNGHFLNALTNAVRNDKVQVILEVRDEDLSYVLKAHSDIRENYTLMDVTEPGPDALRAIIDSVCAGLVKHHGVRISDEAKSAAIELTTKYQTEHLSEAQPARAATLLDRALSTYRLNAHSNPPALVMLQAQLNKASEVERPSITERLRAAALVWSQKQEDIKRLYAEMRKGESAILELEGEIARIKEEDRQKAEARKATIPGDYEKPAAFAGVASFMIPGASDTAEIQEKRQQIEILQKAVADLRVKWAAITAEVNADLELDRANVTSEFSVISGIATNKLNEDESAILQNLESTLAMRVFGQDHVLRDVANAIKVAKMDRLVGIDSEKPMASFLFMGPSGVGKTEVARCIAQALGMPLLRFDMSEYMEKHAVARLIGAPPGYEGFEAGGALTNALRKNRRVVILFDEMEKAHKDVFDLMLQVIDAGRLTDNVGRVADFTEAIVIFTTNVGQPYFLDKNMPFDEAVKYANLDLEQTYRPEFLNRFNGRQNIICYNRLELPSIERIVRRSINEIDTAYSKRGLRVTMEDSVLRSFCESMYDPKMGARGLPGFIQARLKPVIVNTMIGQPGKEGTFAVKFEDGAFDVEFA